MATRKAFPGTAVGETVTSYRAAALAAAAMALFLAPFTSSAINVALPPMGKEFQMDALLLNWVATSYLLATAVFLVPFGRISDIYGRKKVFATGIVVYTVFSLLSTLANSAAMLIAFRVCQGLGNAMIAGTSVAIVTSVFPAKERGKALGIITAAIYGGLSLGPSIGGVLTEHFGWRSIFVANMAICLAIIVAVFWKLKGEWAEARGEKLDVAGSTVYGLGLLVLMYGISRLPQAFGFCLFAAGIIAIGSFIWWETRAPSPVLNLRLFRGNTLFLFSNVAALINYSSTFAAGFLLSLYLQYVKGFSPQHAGLVLIAQPIVMAVLSPLAGRLSDRMEPRVVATFGMALTCAGLAMLIFVGRDTGLPFIVLSLLVLGAGFGIFSSPNTNGVMSSVEKKFYGVASGTLATMRTIGQMLSLGITMVLFALFMGRTQITPEVYPQFLQSLRTAFIVFTILCFCGIFASLSRGKRAR